MLTPQVTGTRRHEDITMLLVQPCRSAAVVGYIMCVRVASLRYAEARCFRLHEGTILNRTTIDLNNPAYFFLNFKSKQGHLHYLHFRWKLVKASMEASVEDIEGSTTTTETFIASMEAFIKGNGSFHGSVEASVKAMEASMEVRKLPRKFPRKQLPRKLPPKQLPRTLP